jgi:BioD-like phosphotransacetylase family protein
LLITYEPVSKSVLEISPDDKFPSNGEVRLLQAWIDPFKKMKNRGLNAGEILIHRINRYISLFLNSVFSIRLLAFLIDCL